MGRLVSRPSAFDREPPLVIAHRGASGEAPENTLHACELAIEQGADVLEIDVRRTADGEVVLFHDEDLVRTTNVRQVFPERSPWLLKDFTLAELRMLDAGSWNDQRFAGARIPTLDEILELAGDRVGLLIEMKQPSRDPGLAPAVAAKLEGRDRDNVVVASIDREHAVQYACQNPGAPVAALTVRPDTALVELGRLAEVVAFIGTGLGEFPLHLVERVHALGIGVLTNSSTASEVRTMAERGLDGVITDYPGRMARALRSDRSSSVWIEAESLLDRARATCPVVVQANHGMNGGKWSNDAQLLMEATGPNETLELPFDIDGDGEWELALVVSGSRHGGVYEISVDDEPLGRPFDSYRASVARHTLRWYDRVLGKGRHVLRLRTTGRHRQSAGFTLGIDVIELVRKTRRLV